MYKKYSVWPKQITLTAITEDLLKWQPTAHSIRFSGTCPNCGNDCEVSYLSKWDGNTPHEDNMENCGYYCGWCGWGNAGARPIEN